MNLHFQRYGITLKPVTRDDLEMLRQWRNDPKIASQMLDKRHISAPMQQAWFEKIHDAEDQAYMVAYFRDEPIGVASLVAIDRAAGRCEPGMYIYPDQYRNNIVPFCVAFALNDLAFETLGMTALYGKIFTDNQASVRFHEACGYRHYGQNDNLALYVLEQAAYLSARDKLAKFIRY